MMLQVLLGRHGREWFVGSSQRHVWSWIGWDGVPLLSFTLGGDCQFLVLLT